MSGRPRLVHEGSPIIEDRGSAFPSSTDHASTSQSHGGGQSSHAHHHATQHHHIVGSNLASLASATKNTTTKTATSKPYKLQTRLVVGYEAKSDPINSDDDLELDVSMDMDEDGHDHTINHNQQEGSNTNDTFEADYSTSRYYGSHGHVYHGHPTQHPQQSVEHNMAFGISAQHVNCQSHQHNNGHTVNNGFYNNNGESFGSANESHHSIPVNPPPPPQKSQIYQMPPPSKSPLVVLDGANIAYNYSESLNPVQGSSQRRQPNPKGIRLAIEYFLQNNCRVQAVVPISWYQL